MARSRERGSALVSVLLLILVAAVLFVGLMTVSLASTRTTAAQVQETQALADARSGLLAAYQQLLKTWNQDGGSGSFPSVSALAAALRQLKADMGTTYTGYPGVSVQIQWQDVNEPDGTGPVGEQVTLVATARRGLVTETMKSTTAVTGTPEAFQYALYSTGNMSVDGPVQITGNAAVASSLYVNPQPWVPNYDNAYDGKPSSSYLEPSLLWGWTLLSYQDKTGLVNVPELSTEEPNGGPTITNGNLYVGQKVYTWSTFTDVQTHKTSTAYTTQMGNVSAYAQPVQVTPNQAIHGNFGFVAQAPAFTTSVGALVDQMNGVLLQKAKNVSQNSLSTLIQSSLAMLPAHAKGYFPSTWSLLSLLSGGGYNVVGTTTIDDVTYVDDDLKVPEGSTLVVNEPLFVDGNLVVSGTLVANAAIYVTGNTFYEPVDAFQNNGILAWLNPTKGVPPRLLIVSKGSLFLSLHPDPLADFVTQLAQGSVQAPAQPVVMHAYLMSGGTVYVDGTEGYYDILGGIAGQNIVLNGLAGVNQRIEEAGLDDYYTRLYRWVSGNLQDTTPRLTIQYDNSFATNPLPGSPMVLTVTVQPMSPPQRVVN